MKATRLALRDFTVFKAADFEFSPGLNIFIGANGTGKSHVLKLLYGVVRPMGSTRPNGAANTESRARLGHAMLEKLVGTFRPCSDRGPLTPLIRHASEKAEVRVEGDFGTVVIGLTAHRVKSEIPRGDLPTDSVVFVSATEVLSAYEGFIAAYDKRELAFDETLRDLCVDLSASPLKKISSPALVAVAAKLEDAVGGKTRLRGGRFFISLSRDWLLEVPMLAEGLRKLGSIAHLIRNGSLAERSVLFWDEPEANVNPKLICTVAQALLALAGAGIQVFVATHDFLLSHEVSLAAEYVTDEAKRASPRFFAFAKPGPAEPVAVESGDTLADLDHNPILEEFAAHYDRARVLFHDAGLESKE